MTTIKALLALEDGRLFPCQSFTGPGEAWGEIVFNTSMAGYQEILTDPSYKGQMVTMTYPLIGNYGVNPIDIESDRVQVSAFLIKEYQGFPSNYRSTETLADYLRRQKTLGIEALDTRAITRHIRNTGAMRAFVSTKDLDPSSLIMRAKQIPSMEGQNLAKKVTTKMPYYWKNGEPEFFDCKTSDLNKNLFKHRQDKKSVVAFDFGIKYNILRCLESQGFEVVVVPSSTTADTIKKMSPDGIFLSNGPGDPEPVTDAIETIRSLLGYRPIFGICLGQQLLGLALGGTTFKLKFGHRGGNQPVKNLLTGRIEITSQNHGFAVDLDTLKQEDIEITHINLNDNTLEGFRHLKYPAFAVQYHPEASPGPHDAGYLFDEFNKMITAF
jgi:carbamoyl-phosphate synthase small subunit